MNIASMKKAVLFSICCLLSLNAFCQNMVINFYDTDIYPKGIAYYPARKMFIVSSMKKGQIGSVNDRGEYSLILQDSSLISTSGLKIKGNDLYVLTGDIGASVNSRPENKLNVARLIKINLLTNRIVAQYELGKLLPGPHFPDDLTLDDQNNVYITDSYAPVIYKVDSTGHASVFVQNEAFKDEQRTLKGIVYHKQGYLLVAMYRKGELYKIDLNNNNEVSQVDIAGDFPGANGLMFTPNYLLVMSQDGSRNKVHILGSNNSWKSARLLRTDNYNYRYPNNTAMVGHKIYVLDSDLSALGPAAVKPSSGSFSIRVIDLQKHPLIKKKRKGKVTIGPIKRKRN